MQFSSNNRIYNNNFLWQPAVSVDTNDGLNTWDDGYPLGGNYWGNSNCTDMYRGKDQNQTGNDGIGDKPFMLDTNNVDNYPLMHPWKFGDANYDGKVNVLDLITVAISLGTAPQSPKWNPRADINNDKVINVLDLILTATHLGTPI